MAITADIFNPQVSAVAKGLEGKTIMIYGGNNLGKTYVASHLSNPFFIACESGLNAISGVKYNRVNSWADFKRLIKQFTNKATVDKAREMYDTIVIDEVYASSILCQDFCITTYGKGALTLGDTQKGEANLYQMYEKEYFRMINLLLSCDYTVVFIGHAQERDGFVSPKGDKRCLNPIVDNCDFVIYLTSNGVDENNKVIKSSGHLAETNEYFARSRFEYCPTLIEEFTAENLEKTIVAAIEGEEKFNGSQVVSYDEQKAKNTSVAYDYDEIMEQLQNIGQRFADVNKMETLTEIVEDTLGAGKKVSECTKKQIDAMMIILDNLKDKAEELGI
jgi:hypothetical protein